jgi:hypothetical protein
LKDAPNYLGLSQVDLSAPRGRVVYVTVATFAHRLGNATRPSALQLAAHCPLDDLLSLDLGHEGPRGQDEAADGRVLELLGDKLQAGAPLLGLIEEDTDLILITREAVNGVGDNYVYGALPRSWRARAIPGRSSVNPLAASRMHSTNNQPDLRTSSTQARSWVSKDVPSHS